MKANKSRKKYIHKINIINGLSRGEKKKKKDDWLDFSLNSSDRLIHILGSLHMVLIEKNLILFYIEPHFA